MVYSYTQISQYLRCPRSYRYRYLDGWREKETRAAMAFGRCFENALGAYFRDEDCGAALFKEWDVYRDAPFEYKKGETWDRLLHQGIHLLQRFVQDDRVRIRNPRENLQIRMLRALVGGSELPISTPSVKLTACVAWLTGRRRRVATRKGLTDYFHLIHSSSVTRGSAEFPRWP